MSVVFLFDKQRNLITFDAVESVTISRNASVTQNTVQSGRSLTDHYHSDLPSITFTGIVTSSKIRTVNAAPSPAAFTVLVNDLIDTAEPFTLYGDPPNGIPNLPNCLIVAFEVIKGASNLDSINSAITVQQIDIGEEAQLGFIKPSIKTNGQLDVQQDTGTGSKTEKKLDSSAYTQLKAFLLGI